ncbi:MAG: 3-hydroxyacyl-ACP dehydratase FabZ [Neisseriaceae bacterium]
MEESRLVLPLEAKDLQGLIPHQFPFLLVDRVLELERFGRIKALKNVTINESYFSGHFPQQPIMPGVLIIEALAQAAAILASASFEAQKDMMYLFAAISEARFKKPVYPGDTLILNVNLLNHKSGVGRFSAYALVEERVAVQAKLTCAQKKVK